MPLIRKATDALSTQPTDLSAVTAALANGTADERWVAARSAHAVPGSAGALGQALEREPDPRVREAIFTSLARISTAESVEVMLPFLRSDEAALRTGALDALGAMKEATWPFLPRLLEDGDAGVRLLACELARNGPAVDATRLLCRLLDAESEANVCASAIEVLAEIGGAEALPAIARCEERFRATPFITFSTRVAAERIRSQARNPGG